MPTFDDEILTSAAPETVWKLLYDPSRCPEWWVGVATVTPGADTYTMYPAGYPDFPMPQELTARRETGTVMISCLVSDLRFDWRLLPEATGTAVSVHVELPDREAHRLDLQKDVIHRSLAKLAELAEADR
jgi:uncharacterized protein YndB with AHSA1/START domain